MEFLRNRLEEQQYEMMVRDIKPGNNTISLFSPEEGESDNEVKVINFHTIHTMLKQRKPKIKSQQS